MTNETKEDVSNLTHLPPEIFSLICNYTTSKVDLDPAPVSKESRKSLAYFYPVFNLHNMQFNRIKDKLSSFIHEGNVDKAAGLLALRPEFYPQILELLAKKLFVSAGLAEQDIMEKILKKFPELLTVYAPLKDVSGASFERITVFQHALWAGDLRYMCNMMLDCLQKNKQGEQLRIELFRQYKELQHNKVIYMHNGTTYQNTLFSLIPLIKVINTYNQNNDWTEEQKMEHCKKIWSSELKRLPAHYRHYYCAPNQSFFDSKFSMEQLTRSLEVQKINSLPYSTEKKLWDNSLDNVDFTIKKINRGSKVEVIISTALPLVPHLESNALSELSNTITNTDFPKLMQRLQQPINRLDEQQNLLDARPRP